MSTTRLLSHLIERFGPSAENLATESLCFILRNSLIASNAFIDFLHPTGVDVPRPLYYEPQQSGIEGSIPDMTCVNGNNRKRVIVENKFWAGLTDNQPLAYISELPAAVPAVLLFIVLKSRLQSTWAALLDCCNKTGSITITNPRMCSGIQVADLNQNHKLAITSWQTILTVLERAVNSAGQVAVLGDLEQLKGLCDRMDTEGFLPLRQSELTDMELPTRLLDFVGLVDDIVREADRQQYCDRKKQALGGSSHYYGIVVRMGDFHPWFGCQWFKWKTYEITPTWLQFFDEEKPQAREKLCSWMMTSPPQCFEDSDGLWVPVRLRHGVERDIIIADCVRQFGEVHRVLLASISEGAEQ